MMRPRAAGRLGRTLVVGGLLAVLAAAPAILDRAGASTYTLRLLVIAWLSVACAVAWDLVGGLAGQVSFGHATFFGVGAFTTAVLVRAGVPWFLTLAPAAAAAAVVAGLWGWPCLRLRGPFFAIATIGVGEATRILALNAEALTGGATGLTLPVSGARTTPYYFALGLGVAALATARTVRRSRLGLGLACIREDIDAAEAIGIRSGWLQLQALALSAAIVGTAGAIYARYLYYVEPGDVFAFNRSIGFILMALIGGIDSVWGPAVGALLFLGLEHALLTSAPSLHLGIYGLLLVAVVLFEPHGVVALARRAPHWGRTRRRPGR
jgi:branched-chain amino acid transport system permease protein